MVNRLTDSQVAYLRSQPTPLGAKTKIPLALALLGITQERFAASIGISPQGFSPIVNGRDIKLSTARRIASALGCGIDDLFPSPPSVSAAGGSRRAPVKAANGRRRKRAPKAQAVAA